MSQQECDERGHKPAVTAEQITEIGDYRLMLWENWRAEHRTEKKRLIKPQEYVGQSALPGSVERSVGQSKIREDCTAHSAEIRVKTDRHIGCDR
jgi:hypothetical protein